MDNLENKIEHLISLIPEDYEKREELVSRLQSVGSGERTWMQVVEIFADVVGTQPMIAAYTSPDDSWLKDVQLYWQQFDGQK